MNIISLAFRKTFIVVLYNINLYRIKELQRKKEIKLEKLIHKKSICEKIGLAGNFAPKKIGLVDKKIGLGEKGVPGNSG